MEPSNSTAIENIRSTDRELHNQAFVTLLAATEQPVDWAYDAWDELIADLYHSDNHVRAIAARALPIASYSALMIYSMGGRTNVWVRSMTPM